jgi:hypothetical protein
MYARELIFTTNQSNKPCTKSLTPTAFNTSVEREFCTNSLSGVKLKKDFQLLKKSWVKVAEELE